jgi:hypothetical protein
MAERDIIDEDKRQAGLSSIPNSSISGNQSVIVNLFVIFAGMMAVSLPSSLFFMSVSQFLLAGVFVAQGVKKQEYLDFFRRNNIFLVILAVIPYHLYLVVSSVYRQLRHMKDPHLPGAFLLFYLVHIFGAFYSSDMHETMVSLRIKLPALLLPIFFHTARGITKTHKRIILQLFVASVFVVSLISFWYFITHQYDDVREVSPFIHHIQFSILMAWSAIILIYVRQHRAWGLKGESIWMPLMVLWFVFMISFVMKVLTSVGVLLAVLYFVLYCKDGFRIGISRTIQRAALILIPLLGITFLTYAFIKFYDTNKIDTIALDETTPWGNPYFHYAGDALKENGNYVFYFINEDELRDVWNQRSEIPYDSLDGRGQEIRLIIIRYLASLGMRRDGHSLQQLSDEQVAHIEQGLANYIYSHRYSLYSRIYQIIWEIDRYWYTSDPSDHSFTQRIESMRIGGGIARQYPLFGVGTGDIKDHYHAVYDSRNTQQKDRQRIIGANQFLNFVVAFGIVGLVIILFAFLYPAIKTGSFRDPLFNAFMIISLVAMFGEDMLKFQAGITFFTFFYCYFVFLKTPEDVPG